MLEIKIQKNKPAVVQAQGTPDTIAKELCTVINGMYQTFMNENPAIAFYFRAVLLAVLAEAKFWDNKLDMTALCIGVPDRGESDGDS